MCCRSQVYDSELNRSHLVIIDAATMEEQCKLHLNHHVPAGESKYRNSLVHDAGADFAALVIHMMCRWASQLLHGFR